MNNSNIKNQIHTITTVEIKMYYIVYKITNLKNNRFYIGKHSTVDINDGYMGSGTALKQAQEELGLKYFKKEILAICDSEEMMNQTEKIFIKSARYNTPKKCYNRVNGGGGYKKDPNKIRFSMKDIMEGRVKLTHAEDSTLTSDQYRVVIKPAA